MNDTVHGHMVQDLLRHRFGSHDNLICKYSSKYPVQAEREFQRLTNAHHDNIGNYSFVFIGDTEIFS